VLPAPVPPTPRPAPAPPPRTGRDRGLRADVQGLRALAVLLVIADHVLGNPVGGFIGVDVFFVISGFLITSLLLRSHERGGRMDYADFYRRRIRRLLPVAVLVLVVTVAATYLLFSRARGDDVLIDAGWALGFLANWHFLAVGTDYFQAGGPVSPLQHYWSLSVEEQFYVVWPTLLAAGLWVSARRQVRWVLPALVGVLLVASLGYSFVHSTSAPVAAYFSTFDRAWELLVGAALALAVPQLSRIPDAVRPLLGWGGLAAILAAAFLIDAEAAFPAPWGLLPVAGTAMVIASGTGSDKARVLPLTNPVAGYVGDISYSLYLWHFPVVVLLPAYLSPTGVTFDLLALVVIAVLSVISFHLVEEPVRRSQWLEPAWRRRSRTFSPMGRARLANGWLAVGLLVTVPLSAAALSSPPPTDGQSILAAQPRVDATGTEAEPTRRRSGDGSTAAPTQAGYLQERLEQSLELTAYPDLQPPVEDLGIEAWYDDINADGCLSVPPADVERCRFGPADAPRTAVVVGDSYAIAYMPTIREALGDDFRIQQLTLQECPVWDAPTRRTNGAPYPECTAYRGFAQDLVAETEPDLLILATAHTDALLLESRAGGLEALDEIRRGYDRALAALVPSATYTIVLEPPPGAPNLQTCVTRVGSPEDCYGYVTTPFEALTEAEREAAEQAGAIHVDTGGWFCVERTCPGFVGTTPVYAEGGHLTVAYARELGPVLREALDVAAQEAQRTS
jgi:peptidoglycan/LPS O-acetylase OafA/YrhL